MDISRQFINNPTRVWLAILLLGVGGLFALLNIGRLEDPAFTIKTAVIVTHYPGASAQQVEEEVTLPLENAIQQLPSLDNVSSISSNGLSQITVNIASQYHSSELPQIWDELRRRVGDASRLFPPGVVTPFVNDDFGDVFGFFFAISGDSFTNPELVRYAEQLRRELVLVPGVGKVAIGGVIPQQINVDISLAKMAARGITLNQLAAILTRLNVVSSAGEIRVGSESIRLHPTGEFQSIDELGDLLVSPHGASATTRLRDIATLSRGLTDSPSSIYHANGRQAVTMGVSFIPGVNVIDVGHALEARLQQMAADKPAGIDIAIFYDQAAEVAHSVNGFITNFLMALAIVVGVLLVFMGVRSGIIIALSLALNVLGTLLIMYIWGIELQRISLGALIIALSMLVDNAIVIVEGVLIARQQGSPLLGAINYVIRRSALPLLGATIIAILASLLLPALNAARERARSAKCLNNIKQHAFGFFQYSDDNRGFMPVSEDSSMAGHYMWRIQIARYIGVTLAEPLYDSSGKVTATNRLLVQGWTSRIFFCDSTPVAEYNRATLYSYGISYLYDYKAGWGFGKANPPWKNPHKLSDIKRKPASETLLNGETSDYAPSSSVWQYQHVLTHNLPPPDWMEWIGNRHNGGINVSWSDGHAGWMSRAALYNGVGSEKKYYWKLEL